MTFISDTCSPWRRLYAVLSGTRQWMDTRSAITATHSLVLFIERRRRRRRRIFTRPMHAHLLNRNNAFLMENSWSIGPRVCWMSPGVPQFIFAFATYKHVNSLCFEIRQKWFIETAIESREPDEHVPDVKRLALLTEVLKPKTMTPVFRACTRHARLLSAFAKGYSNKSGGTSYN